jgi:hypothetical protein
MVRVIPSKTVDIEISYKLRFSLFNPIPNEYLCLFLV